MKLGYTYIENNRLVWNAKRKPEPFVSMENLARIASGEITAEAYVEAVLSDWKKGCVLIKNAKKMQPEIGAVSTDGYECIEKSEVMWFVVINEKWEYISPGQKAYIDGRIIVKLG